jgi:hypothetical protein
LAHSLPRSKVIHDENNQISKGGINDSNSNAKALAINQHRLGGYIVANQVKIKLYD